VAARANLAPVFHARFTLVAHLPLVLGVAVVAPGLPGRATRAAFLGAVILLTQTGTGPARKLLSRGESFPRMAREDWREGIAFLNTYDAEPGWPVFVRSGLIETDAMLAASGTDPQTKEYLTFGVRGPYQLRNPDRPVEPLKFDGTLAGDWQVNQIRTAGGGWFLLRGDVSRANAALGLLRDQLRAAGLSIVPDTWFDGVNVVVFRVRVSAG
jgi:hypothetical protein